MKTIMATHARRDFFNLVKGATEGHQTFKIQHPSGTAILLSEEDYEGLLETLELLSLPDFGERIRQSVAQVTAGETYSLDDVFGADV